MGYGSAATVIRLRFVVCLLKKLSGMFFSLLQNEVRVILWLLRE